MSRMENASNGNNVNNENSTHYDSAVRGYSRRHSYYDNAFNMDFEYRYLELISNFGTFVSRTHEMYSNMETCVSTMIEMQNERRRLLNRRREYARNNRDLHEQRHAVVEESHESQDSHTTSNDDIPDNQQRSEATDGGGVFNRTTRDARDTREINNNSRTTTGTGLPRNSLFDIGSVIYSIPRTVLLNPNTNTTTSNRGRNGGLTISEIEENTEIMTYGSIPSNYILNTECPITRETFTPESVVLTLKQCKHCFVPFRMMTWLETNSTCPLCRCNVVRVETPQTTTVDGNTATATATATANTATTNTDNMSISNIFNNLLQNRNNDFSNLSIDNVNDNSIMFSFDLPTSQLNRQNTDTNTDTNDNTLIIPQIERLISNTFSRNVFNNSASVNNTTPPDSNNNNNNTINPESNDNDDYNYPEVD